MLDLIFLVLCIVVIVRANKGMVNETLCNVALVFGVLAGGAGLIQAFFIKGSSVPWELNIVIIIMAFVLKRAAYYLAKLFRDREDEDLRQYKKSTERLSRYNDKDKPSVNFDDPNVRFGGGDGSDWNGK